MWISLGLFYLEFSGISGPGYLFLTTYRISCIETPLIFKARCLRSSSLQYRSQELGFLMCGTNPSLLRDRSLPLSNHWVGSGVLGENRLHFSYLSQGGLGSFVVEELFSQSSGPFWDSCSLGIWRFGVYLVEWVGSFYATILNHLSFL